MTAHILAPPDHPKPLPAVNRVAWSAPFTWLARGWHDLAAMPGVSFWYGALFAFLGAVLLLSAESIVLIQAVPALIAAFLLVGPALAVGLYAAARSHERGENPTLTDVALTWHRNPGVALLALALMLLLLAWFNVAMFITAGFATGIDQRALSSLPHFLDAAVGGVWLAPFATAGLLFALAAFTLSVVSFPLLLDRPDEEPVSAVVTSMRTVWHNPLPMLLWGTLIVALVAVGFLTYLLGLVVVLPWLGYATWHAYRDLVAP